MKYIIKNLLITPMYASVLIALLACQPAPTTTANGGVLQIAVEMDQLNARERAKATQAFQRAIYSAQKNTGIKLLNTSNINHSLPFIFVSFVKKNNLDKTMDTMKNLNFPMDQFLATMKRSGCYMDTVSISGKFRYGWNAVKSEMSEQMQAECVFRAISLSIQLLTKKVS